LIESRICKRFHAPKRASEKKSKGAAEKTTVDCSCNLLKEDKPAGLSISGLFFINPKTYRAAKVAHRIPSDRKY